jgi:hypothetical protein
VFDIQGLAYCLNLFSEHIILGPDPLQEYTEAFNIFLFLHKVILLKNLHHFVYNTFLVDFRVFVVLIKVINLNITGFYLFKELPSMLQSTCPFVFSLHLK